MAKKDSKKRKNPGGRPKKADSAKRTERIELFVFGREKQLIESRAAELSMSLADYVRGNLGLDLEGYGAGGEDR